MTNYVYSTLTASVAYAGYTKHGNGDLVTIEHQVTIKGGAGVADKNFVTPRGVVTEVSDSDLEFLNKNPVFKNHVENGFITIERKQFDVEKVIGNMKGRDKSSPITPEDYDDGKAPKTNASEDVIVSRRKQNKFDVSNVHA